MTLAGDLPPARFAALRELRCPRDGHLLDTVLVLRFDGPHSSTGEDIVEFQCHGGRAVVDAVLRAVTSCPQVRLARPGEFTRRALAAGKIDLMEAEGLADLLAAETEAQRRSALALSRGGMSRQVDRWRVRAVALSARAEAAIDYVGDEAETALDLGELCRDASALRVEVEAWLARPRIEGLKDGIRVVVAGPPNAGKSSLVNALAQSERAIVTEQPGTTRDTIEVPVQVEGIALLLVDTAGLRDTKDEIEAAGILRAKAEARRAEILLWLGSPDDAPDHPHLLVVRPKADLPGQAGDKFDIGVSALTGFNLANLTSMIVAIARELLPAEGEVALNRRQALLLEQACIDLVDPSDDVILLAEKLRACLFCFDQMTGRVSIEDALDALFEKFCLGK